MSDDVKPIFTRGHEEVVFINHPKVGLQAIIAIHNTVLGPALGGCRMWQYATPADALEDVLRLAEGMTYKSAIAGMDLGGGKAVVLADPHKKQGRRELFEKLGECIQSLSGRYVSAEDMGTGVDDIMAMRAKTSFVTGGDAEKGGAGDPSPWTAKGVLYAIQAACERTFGSADLANRSVSVQGVGHVGMALAELLAEKGAHLIVTDTVKDRAMEAKRRFNADIVKPDDLIDAKVDIYAPCAAGKTVTLDSLKRLNCKIIAGAANNQLSGPEVYSAIEEKGMLYCPDFVINSGGVINVGAELIPGGYSASWVAKKVDDIYGTTARVLDESKRRGKFPEVVALELAKERIAAAEG